MSLGSLSREAHENLAIAMNRIGGKSNTGEGGEDPVRYRDERRSAIKQVASGRFGVTIDYLVNADELQIKMAQGAKPGEGGQLPGRKVDEYIGKIRHSTPGVGLISPPPHHDIYSIEDLKQLIYDLRCANPTARISVKLVAEVGVGTVAAGVAKANSDHVLISGHDGGTGASPLSSIFGSGIPWEIGLAETQQTLLRNDLRSRIWVQADGQLKTGRDVAIAAMLGADEMGFATAPLIASGCIMMRVCHLNTCPVGIATQDPELRKRFAGTPEHVINYFHFVAEDVRADPREPRPAHVRRAGRPRRPARAARTRSSTGRRAASTSRACSRCRRCRPGTPLRRVRDQEPVLGDALDWELIEHSRERDRARRARRARAPGAQHQPLRRRPAVERDRAPPRRRAGSTEDSISVRFAGSAGQSFGGWLAPGVTFTLDGVANDYTGKGLSGGMLAVRPPADAAYRRRGERDHRQHRALRRDRAGAPSSAASPASASRCATRARSAVVEGVGDHGCEYMTGGRVVVLGPTGRNFAAGMSGGVAYVYDEVGDFTTRRCNRASVSFEEIDEADAIELRALVAEHAQRTGSAVAARLLARLGGEPRALRQGDAGRLPPRARRAGGARRRAGRGQLVVPPRRVKRLMGELQGLHAGRPRADPGARCARAPARLPRVHAHAAGRRAARAGRALHGLRRAVLPLAAARSGNLIPDWNDLVYRDRWQDAIRQLHYTNNFPEFTGRLCPAPCEAACVLEINEGDAVTIKQIENAIINRAFDEGWVAPAPPAFETGRRVAVVGSGPGRPRGRAAAAPRRPRRRRLRARRGGRRAGPLRRARLQDREVGRRAARRPARSPRASSCGSASTSASTSTRRELREEFDAVVLAIGARVPRDLAGRRAASCHGTHFAMEYLYARNRWAAARVRPAAGGSRRRR